MQIQNMQVDVLLSVFHCARLSKAIENLQHFTLDADPSFRHFQLDVSKELKLLTELNFIQGERGSDERKGGGRERTKMEIVEGDGVRKEGSEEEEDRNTGVFDEMP